MNYYTEEDEQLIEIHAAQESFDRLFDSSTYDGLESGSSLELDGQAVIEFLMFNGFDR